MTESRGEWKTGWMFRQNSASKQNAGLIICVIPVRGELMEVALPGALMHAQILAKRRIFLGEPGSWMLGMGIVLTSTPLLLEVIRSQ